MRGRNYTNAKPGPNVPPLGKVDNGLYLLGILLTIRTVDNKLILFCVHDFVTGEGQTEIDQLRRLLEQYPQERIRCENGEHLSRLYGRYGYDREDQEYLEALFCVD